MSWYKQLDKNLKADILEEWENLLQGNLTENYYQNFLSENAGLFLGNDNCHLIISQLKLGSEYETDFVALTDNFSNGNQFELIEIKQPSARLFTDKGLISAEFNRATQQIRDWKRWLIDNKSWFKKFLPTDSTRVINDSQIKFKIIIGRRITKPEELEKRNQIGNEIGAEIRSFDYLTDKFKRRRFYPTAWLADGIQEYETMIANPFYKAMSDSEWKSFCKNDRISTCHFYSGHYEEILKQRKYNNKYNNKY